MARRGEIAAPAVPRSRPLGRLFRPIARGVKGALTISGQIGGPVGPLAEPRGPWLFGSGGGDHRPFDALDKEAAMFSKDTKPKSDSEISAPSSSAPPQPISATPSIISADLRITGNLQSNGDIQIDGKIEGDIDSKSLTIGEDAEVNGTIVCERIRVCGQVSGEIKATAVVLARSAKVTANIAHKSLEIESGARLEGSVRHLDSGSARGAETSQANASETSKIAKISEVAASASTGSSAEGSAASL
jgi:cytoskeletal protein CcmA (bactofilin family)